MTNRKIKKNNVTLEHLNKRDEERFINELQTSFQVAVTEQFGPSDDFVISRKEIESSLHAPNAESYKILLDGVVVGGLVVVINPQTQHNSLDLLYVNPETHGRGVGLKAWELVEARYPKTRVWETHTPYFEKRNIHFYVNKCGFHIVEFFNPRHKDPHESGCSCTGKKNSAPDDECMFRFEKVMER